MQFRPDQWIMFRDVLAQVPHFVSFPSTIQSLLIVPSEQARIKELEAQLAQPQATVKEQQEILEVQQKQG